MEDQIGECWDIHNRIHLYLLQAIPDEALHAEINPKSRSVYALFAHMHNVRLMWLKSAAPDLLESQVKLEAKPVGTKDQLQSALTASGIAISTLLRKSVAEGTSIKGFKPHVTAFLGYLISHESHHRGQIEWALKQSGFPLSDTVSYGLWEWGVR